MLIEGLIINEILLSSTIEVKTKQGGLRSVQISSEFQLSKVNLAKLFI